MKKAILLNENDNVATLLDDISAGEELKITDVRNNTVNVVHPTEAIPRGHKIATFAMFLYFRNRTLKKIVNCQL